MANTDFTIDRTEIVTRALKRIGNANPSTADLADAVNSLNIVTKEIDPRGRWLWKITAVETQLDIVTAQTVYPVGLGPPSGIANDIWRLERFDLEKGVRNFTPLLIVDKTRSLTSFERESQGEPFEVNLERTPKPEDQRIIIRPEPSGPFTAKYTYQKRILDFDSSTDEPDFPQEWINPLILMLAADLSDEYGLPLPERQWLRAEADRKFKEAKAANAENFDFIRAHAEYF